MFEPYDKKCILAVPADTFYLDLIRKAVCTFARKCGLSEDKTSQLEIAVDEACTNAINYAYENWTIVNPRKEDLEKGLWISLYSDAAKVGVVIFDRGRPFDDFESRNINIDEHLDEMRTRGLGVHIIKTFVDEVGYRHIPKRGNVLELVKYTG